jgi:hypothetical protein
MLYVETGFPIGVAKGQDRDAAALLDVKAPDFSIRILIPSICFMEALSVWESEHKQYNTFMDILTAQLREIGRDVISAQARVLVGHLGQSRVESEIRFGAVQARLNEVLYALTEEAEIINLDADMIRDSLMNDYVDDPTDNLILSCILRHAHLNPLKAKAFFSANHKHFGDPQVCQLLEAAGIKYFRRIDAAVGWLRAQAGATDPPEPGAA